MTVTVNNPKHVVASEERSEATLSNEQQDMQEQPHKMNNQTKRSNLIQ